MIDIPVSLLPISGSDALRVQSITINSHITLRHRVRHYLVDAANELYNGTDEILEDYYKRVFESLTESVSRIW